MNIKKMSDELVDKFWDFVEYDERNKHGNQLDKDLLKEKVSSFAHQIIDEATKVAYESCRLVTRKCDSNYEEICKACEIATELEQLKEAERTKSEEK